MDALCVVVGGVHNQVWRRLNARPLSANDAELSGCKQYLALHIADVDKNGAGLAWWSSANASVNRHQSAALNTSIHPENLLLIS